MERRLAAILAADVVGYSRLVSADEADALTRLGMLRRAIIEPNIASHSGRLFKIMGDGFLAEFASAVQATSCALAIQRETEAAASNFDDLKKMRLRIGIHVGDVLVEGDDLMGYGVNIAARLENIAAPGGLSISRAVHDQVRDRIPVVFDDKGEIALKNIGRPVQVFTFADTKGISRAPNIEAPTLALPDKPSIAVLPFQNMSGDPEQEYFADGMVEDIITALSRFKWLFVIARNSSFTFKGKAVDIKEVGRRLGVRYVLEGSVRKAAGKVRITGQLIDAVTAAHLWADRFERDLTDVFALQDEVTVAVVSAIQPKLLETEIEIATRRPTENLTAYDLSLRARKLYNLATREANAEALQLLHRALELDPRFVSAATFAARTHRERVAQGYSIDPQIDRNEATRLVRLALSLDENDSFVLGAAALNAFFFEDDYETAIDFSDRAVALNPNDPVAWRDRGWVYKYAGQHEEAIRSFERCTRLSPLDPYQHSPLAGTGYALIELRRFDEAVTAAKKALRHNLTYAVAHRCLAAALAHLGRDAEVREAAARLLEVDPSFTISGWIARGAQSNSKLLIEGLRKAGLPE